ncbi:MAG: hypothetical protein AAF252_04030, partial [Pseudomonadota bacterium]
MSDSDTENNVSAGQIPEQRTAGLKTSSRPLSVPSVMILAVALGFVVGFMLSVLVAPALGFAFGLGGAMSFGAAAVALFLFRAEPVDERQSGDLVRTDQQARTGLAESKARKK